MADEDLGGLDFGPSVDLAVWLDSHLVIPEFVLPSELSWHPASQSWIDLPWWDPSDQVVALWFYTDGSRFDHGLGAAVVLWVLTSHGWRYGGFLAHSFPLGVSSYQMELYALVLATKWAHDILKFQQRPHEIEIYHLFDSTSAGWRSTGHWQGKTFIPEAQCARSLYHYIEQRFGCCIQGRHILSHQGDPGNEAANTLAQMAALGQGGSLADDAIQYILSPAAAMPLAWLYMLYAPTNEGWWHGDRLHPPLLPKTVPTQSVLAHGVNPEQATQQPSQESLLEATLQFTLLSANVCTLGAGTQGDLPIAVDPARLEALFKQCLDAHVQIVCLQETRLRKTAFRDNGDFLIFQSSSDRGQGGMLVAINKHLAYGEAHNQVLKFGRDHFKIVAHTPRLLILRIKAPGFRCLLLGVHAPHSGTAQEDLKTWWASLEKAIPKNLAHWPWVLMGDMNARLGSNCSPSVGTFGSEMESFSGSLLHHAVLSRQLWLPATYDTIHQGDTKTWRHAGSGKWSRLDYICIPQTWSCTESRVDDRIDISHGGHIDHLPVSIVVQIATCIPNLAKRVCFRKLPSIEHTAEDFHLLDSELRWQVRQPDWDVDVHTHTSEITEDLQRVCSGLTNRPRSFARKTALSTETWDMIVRKRYHRNQFFWFCRNDRLARLRLLFRCWKEPKTADLTQEQFDAPFYDNQIAYHWGNFKRLGKQVANLTQDNSLMT